MTAPVPSIPRTIDWEDVKRRITAAIEQTEALLELGPDAETEERTLPASDADAVASDDPVRASNLVSFVLSHRRFALNVRYIWEIVSVGHLSALPGTPPYVRGIYDLRGQLLPVFDLRDLLDLSQDAPTDAAWALVCGETQPEFLILTDETPEMREIGDEELASARSEGMGGTFGQAITRDGTIVLDGTLLFDDRRLFLEGEQPAADTEEVEDEAP